MDGATWHSATRRRDPCTDRRRHLSAAPGSAYFNLAEQRLCRIATATPSRCIGRTDDALDSDPDTSVTRHDRGASARRGLRQPAHADDRRGQMVAGTAIRYAHEHAAPGAAIAVVDAGGMLIYAERLDGTFQNAANISIGKARTAVLFGKPTRVFEDIVNKGRYAMLALPEVAPFTPLMGGVPIEIGGRSPGRSASAARRTPPRTTRSPAPRRPSSATQHAPGVTGVTVVPRATVDAGFRERCEAGERRGIPCRCEPSRGARRSGGAPARDRHLLRPEGQRRPRGWRSGRGEHPVADGELRGSAIEGGETRHIGAGDVIIIPHGIPHWFKKVTVPFTYYVVKSSSL